MNTHTVMAVAEECRSINPQIRSGEPFCTASNLRAHEYLLDSMMPESLLDLTVWAANGYQRVQFDHDTTALLAGTSLRMAPECPPPWYSFAIEPTGLKNPEGVRIAFILVVITKGLKNPSMALHWCCTAVAESGEAIIERGLSWEELVLDGRSVLPKMDWETNRPQTKDSVIEYRFKNIIRRISAGAALLLASHKSSVLVKKQFHKAKPKRPANTITSISRTSKLSFELKQALSDYMTGKRGSLSIRHMVRGHWRNQAHGVGLKEHKTIWIEPFWKGPDGAPEAQQTKVVSG